jgi:hypothetical protein
LASKILYSIDEVATITKLAPLLITQYVRMKKRAITPELLPDLNPKYIKGEPFFTQKDIDELLNYIDKRKDESWENWHLRRVKETIAKREFKKKKKKPQKPDLRIVEGKKRNEENT